jgi:hypothetical protein
MSEKDEQQARDRIEEARSDAAAYIVQRAPLEQVDSSADEQKLLDVAEQARTEDDPGKLDKLADKAEQAARDIRREAYGEDREPA